MTTVVRPPARLEGVVTPPGDKSISHRAAIFNAMASGEAVVSNYSPGADCASTLACLRKLGAKISSERNGESRLVIRGRGVEGLREADGVLNAGNSGTTMRLMTGMLASLPFMSIITGDASLRTRPMKRIVEPLTMMGAHIMGRQGDSLAPLAIRGGNLQGVQYSMPVASAQLKSSILLAGLQAQGETVLHQPAASRDHTERMLRAMGAQLVVEGLRVSIRPSSLSAIDVTVPADISSAAFWLVAACCHPKAQVKVSGVCVNPSRTGSLDILGAMGASISLENVREEGEEPVADIVVCSSNLVGTVIEGEMIPRVLDEIPALAVAACFADGETVIRDAQELRVKESDRIGATVMELSRMGARIQELPDGMIIQGGEGLKGAHCGSHGDHRLAMALAAAGLLAQGETAIEGSESADVSYPGFWRDLEALSTG